MAVNSEALTDEPKAGRRDSPEPESARAGPRRHAAGAVQPDDSASPERFGPRRPTWSRSVCSGARPTGSHGRGSPLPEATSREPPRAPLRGPKTPLRAVEGPRRSPSPSRTSPPRKRAILPPGAIRPLPATPGRPGRFRGPDRPKAAAVAIPMMTPRASSSVSLRGPKSTWGPLRGLDSARKFREASAAAGNGNYRYGGRTTISTAGRRKKNPGTNAGGATWPLTSKGRRHMGMMRIYITDS